MEVIETNKNMPKKFFLTIGIILVLIIVLLGARTTYAAVINATGLVGQTDGDGNPVYTTSAENNGEAGPNARGLDYPTNSVLDPVDHRLFVVERDNNRVLAFSLDANNHILSTTAIFVLGASDFTTAGSGAVTQNTFGGGDQGNYIYLAYDSVNKRLFVSVCAQHRVLAFNVPSNADSGINGENAIFVLGQPDFISSSSGTTQSTMYGPDNMIFDSVNNRLFVTDQFNNRVLVFSIPTNADSGINGKNADYVLGQPDFTSKGVDTTQNRFNNPLGVVIDTVNNRLFVSDYYNNRVMVFSVPPGTDITGKNADYVLGQPDFTTATSGTTQNTLWKPDNMLGYDPVTYRLFVSDSRNRRVMVFIVPPETDITGENAQNVLGQEDWISIVYGVTQSKFVHPNGQDSFDSANNILFVLDIGYNRVMEFSMINITTTSFPNGNVGTSYSQAIATAHAQGTSQSFSLYSGSLPAGLSLNTSTGVVSGTPATSGTATFTIEADDNFATGPFFDRVAYTMTTTAIPIPPGGIATHNECNAQKQCVSVSGGNEIDQCSSNDDCNVCDPHGDINKDGSINIVDFSILMYFWQQTNPSNPCADINKDGIVDLADFSIMLYWWTR